MTATLITRPQKFIGSSRDRKPKGAPVGSQFYDYSNRKTSRTHDGKNFSIESHGLPTIQMRDWWLLEGSINSDIQRATGTHVRASNGLYTNPDTDLITTVGNNIPRFESVGGLRAILLEPAGTNLIHYSHELDNAWWTDTRLTSVTANGMLAPDGNTVADGLVATVDDNSHYIRTTTHIGGIAQNDKIALTVFAKPGNKNWVRLSVAFYDNGDIFLGDEAGYYFNISSGVIGSKIEDGNATVHDYMIEEAANGFYRIGIIISNSDAVTDRARVYFFSAHADNDVTFPGDTTTVNTWLWGADLKKQAYFDSYVPTSGATATRATESGYPLWTLPPGLFDLTGMCSVWVRFGYAASVMPDPTFNKGIVATQDSGNSVIRHLYSGGFGFFSSSDGTNQSQLTLSHLVNTWYKVVAKWGYGGKSRLGVDSGSGIVFGTEVVFDGSYTLGANLRLAYGLFGTMWIRDLRLFDRVLTDAEVNALGSP